MDLQILCARRVPESSNQHHQPQQQHSPPQDMMPSNGGGGVVKLPSLVPPAAGMWFQEHVKLPREKPPEATAPGDKANSPHSPHWFPQQHPSKELPDIKPNPAVWFQPESQVCWKQCKI